MNKELIQKLIKQSYFYDEPNDSTIFDREKFAELIVLECASIVDQRPNVLIGQTTGGWLREQFGVTKDD